MTKREGTPTLGMCVDDNYVWPLALALYSAKINSSREFKVELANINNGISLQNQKLLLDFSKHFGLTLNITDHNLDFDVQHDKRISQAGFGRFFLLDSLTHPFIYADADVVFDSGWDEIFDWIAHLSKEGKWLLAARVEANLPERMSNEPENQARIAAGDKYFHSGLMSCNSPAWQKGEFSNKWRGVAKQYASLGFRWHDQDVLNYLIAGEILELPDRFDRIFGESRFAPSSILSCDGNIKPWRVKDSEIEKLTFLVLSRSHKYTIGWLNDALLYWEYEDRLIADMSLANFSGVDGLLGHRRQNEIPVLNKQLNLKYLLVKFIMRDFSKMRFLR